jgi:hypothetical protein
VLHAAVLAVFTCLQFVPYAFPGDSATTGEGRLFALHMFDAIVVCEARLTYHLADGTTREDPLAQAARLPHRSRCDPVIFFDLARNACRRRAGYRDLDLSLRSGHGRDPQMRQTIDVRSFCEKAPTYDLWRHNAWILSE